MIAAHRASTRRTLRESRRLSRVGRPDSTAESPGDVSSTALPAHLPVQQGLGGGGDVVPGIAQPDLRVELTVGVAAPAGSPGRLNGVRTVNGSSRFRLPRAAAARLEVDGGGLASTHPDRLHRTALGTAANACANSGPPTLSSTPNSGSVTPSNRRRLRRRPARAAFATCGVPTAATTWAPALAASCTANRPTRRRRR